MCGIIGIFDFSGEDRRWPGDKLEKMVKALAHRGPDDTGIIQEPGLFLGHTRLAVLDLTLAGHQPMNSHDDRHVITYNGEIYNFRELRDQLEDLGRVFKSGTDTEVLVEAWSEWGDGAIEKIEGIFAFAIFDRQERRLCLVRDRLGVKPLFYYLADKALVFSSEPLAMFGPVFDVPAFEPEDLDSYFTFNYLPGQRSGLKGVKQLEAGCYLKVDAGAARMTRYWSLPVHSDPVPWSDSLPGQFGELINKATTRQMVSDVPLGVFLSGGLDSYAVTRSSVRSGKPLAASFTLGFDEPGMDERPAAREYAEYLSLKSETGLFSFEAEDINRILSSMGELLADASCFPFYQLSRLARSQVTVALSGDGGDELLAGYDTYKAGRIMPYLRILPAFLRRLMGTFTAFLPASGRYSPKMVAQRLLMASEQGPGRDHASFRMIFTPEMKRRIYRPEFLKQVEASDPIGEYAGLINDETGEMSYLSACQRADLKFHLPSILAKVDRMSMAHGLEVRVPLLDENIVSFCLRLSDGAKRHRGKGKRVLRDALAGDIPPSALGRAKAGFLPPVDSWFRDNQAMREVFANHLALAKQGLGWLDWAAVETLWEDHRRSAVDAGFVLLGILQFINWCEQCKQR